MTTEIQKLSEYEITSRDGNFINADCATKIINTLVRKINELVDAVNELQHDNSGKANCPENVQPDYVTTSYMTDGHRKEYYGQKGASIVTDPPLPAGYVITIREPETKGGDNE